MRNLFMLTAPKQGWRMFKVTVLRELVEVHFTQAETIVLVCDNLNMYHPSCCTRPSPLAETRSDARLEWHYTLRHGTSIHPPAMLSLA